MIFAYNIGTFSTPFGSGGLTNFPIIREEESFSELSKIIRYSIDHLWKLAEQRYIIPSSLCLYISVGDHNFRIRLINVREYRAKWEDKYKTKYKHG